MLNGARVVAADLLTEYVVEKVQTSVIHPIDWTLMVEVIADGLAKCYVIYAEKTNLLNLQQHLYSATYQDAVKPYAEKLSFIFKGHTDHQFSEVELGRMAESAESIR